MVYKVKCIKKASRTRGLQELRIQTMTLPTYRRDVLKPVFFDNKKASQTRGLHGVKDSNHDSPDLSSGCSETSFFDNKKASQL